MPPHAANSAVTPAKAGVQCERRRGRLGWVRRAACISAGIVAVLLITALALDRLYPPDLSRLADRSTLVVDSDGRLLTPFTARDGIWRLPVGADQVDARYLRMLVAYEDKRFDRHWGVDPLALLRAVGQWARAGRVVSG